MLKALAVFAVLLAVTAGDKGKESSRSNLSENNCKDHGTPTVSLVNKETLGPNAQTPRAEPAHWYGLPEWWLCILGVPTLIYLVIQTNAARNAAEAALLNAQAVINAERPWLLVAVKSMIGPMGGFSVHARNKGRTPALITAAHIGCVAVKDISALPEKAPYGPGNLMQNKIVIPSGAVRIIWFDDRMLQRMLKEDFPTFPWDGRVFVFGRVLYRDLANPDPSVIHETRWIGLYEGPVGDEGNSIFRIEGIGIPDEYDRHT